MQVKHLAIDQLEIIRRGELLKPTFRALALRQFYKVPSTAFKLESSLFSLENVTEIHA